MDRKLADYTRLRPEFEEQRETRALTVQVELVTHQLGGGARAREADPDQWLRPSSVRGALRFWWRALYGSRYRTLPELYLAESAIFGGITSGEVAGTPGKVAVVIHIDRPAQAESWRQIQDTDAEAMKRARTARGPGPVASALSVAYFPANEIKEGPREGQAAASLLVPGCKATLSVGECPTGSNSPRLTEEQWRQVGDALRAFIVFGGSGSRSRRAAGALIPASAEDARKLQLPVNTEALAAWLRPFLQPGTEHPCFLLSRFEGLYATADCYHSGRQAQEALLAMWRDFRQQRRHPESWFGSKDWGRTKWPEADALRILAGQHAAWDSGGQMIDHKPEQSNKGRAPRAHLGLPIVVKFKDDEQARAREERQREFRRGRWLDTDPPSSQIVLQKPGKDGKPAVVDRYASPVLLAVTSVFNQASDNKRELLGLVLITRSVLNHEHEHKHKVVVKESTERLDPGLWDEVLQSKRSPYGLCKVLSDRKFKLLLSKEPTK